eukprot:TRINITY_DN5034_c0_g1_i1.p1 TRINITY_DN5034_c0_g1~~TRINITY_DN5034_c0_g1_i1.p1  ORF type:complete len:230 (+),score=88.07 TRINITY_DN5034_c0_g1_i1:59-748(+)
MFKALSSVGRALSRAPAPAAGLARALRPATLPLSSRALATNAAAGGTPALPAAGGDVAGDPERRNFAYFVLTGSRLVYASAVRFAVVKFLATLTASAEVLALAKIEVDVTGIPAGETSLVIFRGKPLFIRHLTEEEQAAARAVPVGDLKDPQGLEDRTIDPAWVVVIGVCTHLGCIPVAGVGDYGGYFCPCHGSHYDTIGRIRKGPAPLNLELASHKFDTDMTLLTVGI